MTWLIGNSCTESRDSSPNSQLQRAQWFILVRVCMLKKKKKPFLFSFLKSLYGSFLFLQPYWLYFFSLLDRNRTFQGSFCHWKKKNIVNVWTFKSRCLNWLTWGKNGDILEKIKNLKNKKNQRSGLQRYDEQQSGLSVSQRCLSFNLARSSY